MVLLVVFHCSTCMLIVASVQNCNTQYWMRLRFKFIDCIKRCNLLNVFNIKIYWMYLTLKFIECIWPWNLLNVFDIEIYWMHLTLKFIECIWHWNFFNAFNIEIYWLQLTLKQFLQCRVNISLLYLNLCWGAIVSMYCTYSYCEAILKLLSIFPTAVLLPIDHFTVIKHL